MLMSEKIKKELVSHEEKFGEYISLMKKYSDSFFTDNNEESKECAEILKARENLVHDYGIALAAEKMLLETIKEKEFAS